MHRTALSRGSVLRCAKADRLPVANSQACLTVIRRGAAVDSTRPAAQTIAVQPYATATYERQLLEGAVIELSEVTARN